jgi:hypothetical protein
VYVVYEFTPKPGRDPAAVVAISSAAGRLLAGGERRGGAAVR